MKNVIVYMSLLFIHFHKQLSDLHMCPYFESGHFMYRKKLDLYNFKHFCLEQQIVCGCGYSFDTCVSVVLVLS